MNTDNPNQSIKLPLILMIGPAAAFILSIILYATINFVIAADSLETSSIFKVVANILLFLLGTGGVLAFVPCLIAGAIMLAKRRGSESESVTQGQHKEPRDWSDLE